MKSDSTIRILLLDNDPIFRLGLIALIQEQTNSKINIIAQGVLDDTLDLLTEHKVDLLLISLDLAVEPRQLNTLISLSRPLEKKYPDLPLLLVTPWGSNEKIKNIANVKGCCARNIPIPELIKAIKICAGGKTYFKEIKNKTENSKIIGGWLYRQCILGLREIEQTISTINQSLKRPDLSTFDIIFLQGKRRELKVVRWLVNQLLPSENFIVNNTPLEPSKPTVNKEDEQKSLAQLSPMDISPSAIIIGESEVENTDHIIAKKIQGSLKNTTELFLETDILKYQKTQELFLIILQDFSQLVEDIKILNLSVDELSQRSTLVIKELWQGSIIKYLSSYLSKESITKSLDLKEIIFNQGQFFLEKEVMNIPFFSELLVYLVLNNHLIIDNQAYSYKSKSALEIEIILKENVVITTALYVMQFILNKLSEFPEIKHNLLKDEWKSSRKIAMFRNNLIWKYRREKYWQNPRNIFEDEYQMFKLGYQGIVLCKITHPRHQELKTLTGIPWLVTILIEFTDSITRGIKALADIVGRTLVFVLTEVLGKGIGLIGKGILQGIGSKIKN